jgi:nucleoside 2-deoxyribosyltransferase
MQYLIDVGSSTIKVYERKDNRVSLVEAKTFAFKVGFESTTGLSKASKTSLYAFFEELSMRFSLTHSNTKLYATGIFREINDKQIFVEEFYIHTRLLFNIISHSLEAFYLEKAWIGKYTGTGNLLVINIGGRTTELLFYNRGVIVERLKLDDIGVSIKDGEYKAINEEYSLFSIEEIMEFVKRKLPRIEGKFDTAIYTGGELTYMQVAGYALQKNTIFWDETHPSMIKLEDYCKQNQRVFSGITISNLKALMPKNPNWMNGARACSAIAQAICTQYGVEMIIPSDSNLIDGVNVQEFRSVVICGNPNKQKELISRLILNLEAQGINVLNRNNYGFAKGTTNYSVIPQSIRSQIRSTGVANSSMADSSISSKNISIAVAGHISRIIKEMEKQDLLKGTFDDYFAIGQSIALISNHDVVDNSTSSSENISVVVCGSFNKHLEHIAQIIKELEKQGIIVLSPCNTDVVSSEGSFVLFKNDVIKNHRTWSVEALHLKAIRECDYVVVCNFDDYVGLKTSFEIGYADKYGKPVIYLEDALLKQAIEECDCVIVCNYENNAINAKTAREIGYAYKCEKKVVFMEDNTIVDDFDMPSEVGLLYWGDDER